MYWVGFYERFARIFGGCKMSIVVDLFKGRSILGRLREPDGVHHAIVGAISFAFIAASVVTIFPGDITGESAILLVAAVVGSLLAKVFVI